MLAPGTRIGVECLTFEGQKIIEIIYYLVAGRRGELYNTVIIIITIGMIMMIIIIRVYNDNKICITK